MRRPLRRSRVPTQNGVSVCTMVRSAGSRSAWRRRSAAGPSAWIVSTFNREDARRAIHSCSRLRNTVASPVPYPGSMSIATQRNGAPFNRSRSSTADGRWLRTASTVTSYPARPKASASLSGRGLRHRWPFVMIRMRAGADIAVRLQRPPPADARSRGPAVATAAARPAI